MSEWSLDCKLKANQLLPDHLNLLRNELSFLLDTITPDLTYTDITSRIHHRIGECTVLAEIAENRTALALAYTLHAQLKSVYSGINYDGSISDIWGIYHELGNIVENLRQQLKEHQVINVGNYKEEV